MNVKPASRGSAAGMPGYYSYEESRSYSYQEPYRPSVTSVQRQPTAQEQRQTALQADCERNRGTDCSNPATLQYLESTAIPRRGRY
jgi:hypothetical protein